MLTLDWPRPCLAVARHAGARASSTRAHMSMSGWTLQLRFNGATRSGLRPPRCLHLARRLRRGRRHYLQRRRRCRHKHHALQTSKSSAWLVLVDGAARARALMATCSRLESRVAAPLLVPMARASHASVARLALAAQTIQAARACASRVARARRRRPRRGQLSRHQGRHRPHQLHSHRGCGLAAIGPSTRTTTGTRSTRALLAAAAPVKRSACSRRRRPLLLPASRILTVQTPDPFRPARGQTAHLAVSSTPILHGSNTIAGAVAPPVTTSSFATRRWAPPTTRGRVPVCARASAGRAGGRTT